MNSKVRHRTPGWYQFLVVLVSRKDWHPVRTLATEIGVEYDTNFNKRVKREFMRINQLGNIAIRRRVGRAFEYRLSRCCFDVPRTELLRIARENT